MKFQVSAYSRQGPGLDLEIEFHEELRVKIGNLARMLNVFCMSQDIIVVILGNLSTAM